MSSSQIDFETKLVTNSYHSLGADYQLHNMYNRPSSHTRMLPPNNYFGIKILKTPYTFDDDNLQYKMPIRPLPKMIMIPEPIKNNTTNNSY
jgi:hypothetical protein